MYPSTIPIATIEPQPCYHRGRPDVFGDCYRLRFDRQPGEWITDFSFFRQSLLPVGQLQHAIRLLSLAIALNLLAFPFASVISGLQRLDLTNLLWALSTIVTASLAAIFVELGKGISGLVDAIVLTSGVLFLLNVVLAWRLLPQLRIRPGLIRLADIKALSVFSLQVYVIQVMAAVYLHTEKLLLAHFAGPTPVGWYEIASDLALNSGTPRRY